MPPWAASAWAPSLSSASSATPAAAASAQPAPGQTAKPRSRHHLRRRPPAGGGLHRQGGPDQDQHQRRDAAVGRRPGAELTQSRSKRAVWGQVGAEGDLLDGKVHAQSPFPRKDAAGLKIDFSDLRLSSQIALTSGAICVQRASPQFACGATLWVGVLLFACAVMPGHPEGRRQPHSCSC
eukprot:TRINITY_DN42839_c0_g1_i2.p4 TRINITY_DN42839_c0_g1~~TRINITY_DN42839_c0_g1_i2.p4  ORF type:complete len:180 (+),score=8.64 TRINITY_DN42839_c0_g1_i2:249-788(+)